MAGGVLMLATVIELVHQTPLYDFASVHGGLLEGRSGKNASTKDSVTCPHFSFMVMDRWIGHGSVIGERN
eukprot:7435426-Pyramimonas_sp.AAC.1